MEFYLKTAGVLLIVLSLIHLAFPRYFRWNAELGLLSPVNRQMMYVHTTFIAFGVLLMGLLSLSSAQELVGTPLGRKISLGLALFWTARLLVQLFGYSTKLWKGKFFETAVHIILTLLWIYFSSVFAFTYFME
jgi:hypothetical protein